jgi:hypothetical protein
MLWGSLGFLLLIGALIILPWFLNPDYLQSLVLRHIQQTVGSHVQVGRTSLVLFPSPHFFVSDIVVKERADSHAVFRARFLSLKLGIGQLLQKKLEVKEFALDYPEIEIRRDRLGIWRFLGHSNEESSFSFLASFLVIGKIEVTNGKIIVIDESPSETVRGVVLENVVCLSDTSYEGVSAVSTLELSGKLRQAQDSASFHLSGTFEATTNVPFSPLDKEQVSFDQMTFGGTMGTRNIAVEQLAEFVSFGELFTQFPGRLNLDSSVKWVRKDMTSQLQFSNIALENPFLTLAGNATIEGLEDGHQMTSVSLRSSSLNLEMVRKVVPELWLPDPLANLWKQGEWGGELKVLDARVTSSTREDVDTSVTGTFQVNNGFLTIPGWPKTHAVRGTIVVEPDRIHASETTGIYDGIEVKVSKGVFLLKEAGAWGDVEIEGLVPAEKVWNFVRDLVEPASEPSGWEVLKVSQGNGLLRLRFSGEVLDEHGLTFQDGDYQPANLMLHIPNLPHPLSNGHGKIQFSPDSTVLEEMTGEMGAYPLTLNGTIIHQGTLRFEPLTVTAGFDGTELFGPANQLPAESGLSITGPLHASVTMRGSMSRLNLKGKVDGTEATLNIPSVLRKEAGQSGILEFDGQVRPGRTIRFERIELAMLPLRLRGQGVARFRQKWGWEGRLDSGPISIGVLPEKIQMFGQAIQSGMLEVQLGGKGIGHDWSKWDVKGWIALTDGVLTIPGIPESIENVFVRLRIDKDLLDLKRMEFHIQENVTVVTGFVKQWNTNPQVSVMWNAPRFDIDLLIPKDERSILRDGVEWLASHGKLEGSLFIERPRYKAFSGNKLSAEVNIHDNLVTVDKLQATVERNGSIKGRVFVHLPPGKPAAVRASFEGNNIPFEKFLMTLGDQRRLISGQMNIRGKVQGHGRDERGIIPTLEGNVEISLNNGYVRQGTVLPQILRILNLPYVLRGKVNFEKTGFPYNSVGATLTIEKGMFSTKDIRLRSPIMYSTAAGIYDLSRDRLDGVIAVSPFGAYSDALMSIPLFGTIFSGDRKGIATAMFNLNGSLSEPQVVYLPMESLGNGLTGLPLLAFDVLKNIILVPVKALIGETNDPAALPTEVPRLRRQNSGKPEMKEE